MKPKKMYYIQANFLTRIVKSFFLGSLAHNVNLNLFEQRQAHTTSNFQLTGRSCINDCVSGDTQTQFTRLEHFDQFEPFLNVWPKSTVCVGSVDELHNLVI